MFEGENNNKICVFYESELLEAVIIDQPFLYNEKIGSVLFLNLKLVFEDENNN